MDISNFKTIIEPLLKDLELTYSSFIAGDFGDLERVEVSGPDRLATVEFWSKGWLGIEVYDLLLDETVMNILLSPEEAGLVTEAFEEFLRRLRFAK